MSVFGNFQTKKNPPNLADIFTIKTTTLNYTGLVLLYGMTTRLAHAWHDGPHDAPSKAP